MTLTDLATAMSEAFQAAPTVEERWPAAARAALQALNERPKVYALNAEMPSGDIQECVPPSGER